MKIINTADLKLLGEGSYKHVYQHPEDDHKVIKVMKRDRASEDGGILKQTGLRRHHQQGIFRQFRRELIQYIQLCKNHYKENRFIFPIEVAYGFMHTDKGLALVTEKITSPDGTSRTLISLCENNEFEEKHAQALDRFFDECCELHIVYGEVNVAGIMYTESRSGRPEFVLVDGIGEKLFVPFRAMSKSINSRNVRKVEQKLKTQLGIA